MTARVYAAAVAPPSVVRSGRLHGVAHLRRALADPAVRHRLAVRSGDLFDGLCALAAVLGVTACGCAALAAGVLALDAAHHPVAAVTTNAVGGAVLIGFLIGWGVRR